MRGSKCYSQYNIKTIKWHTTLKMDYHDQSLNVSTIKLWRKGNVMCTRVSKRENMWKWESKRVNEWMNERECERYNLAQEEKKTRLTCVFRSRLTDLVASLGMLCSRNMYFFQNLRFISTWYKVCTEMGNIWLCLQEAHGYAEHFR